MAFITTDYLKSLGYTLPESSVSNVQLKIDQLITGIELEYLQHTIGYSLTNSLYALVEPYPDEVKVFLDGNFVDGDLFYTGIKREIGHFIMAMYYGGLPINVNNSGFSSAISDGEQAISVNFIVNTCINKTHHLRSLTYTWLNENITGFFAGWKGDYFKTLSKHSVW